MKNLLLIALCFIALLLPAQKRPGKKEVKALLAQTMSALRSQDSIAFKNLFIPDTAVYYCEDIRRFQEINMVYSCYSELRAHLKEVLERNIDEYSTGIEKVVYTPAMGSSMKAQTMTDYEITAEFKLSGQSLRSFTFPVGYYQKRLVFLAPCAYGSSDYKYSTWEPVRE